MTPLQFIVASLRHFRRIHVAAALGVAVATAVLTGAMLVGDSVRGSLRALTLARLGRVDSVLVADRPFRTALAEELSSNTAVKQHFAAAEPALLTVGTLQSGSGTTARRATAISVVGCRDAFWSLGQGGPARLPAGDGVVLTESVASELAVRVGDRVLLRIPAAQAIPADSPLGEKSETSRARQLDVVDVLPPEGLARFGLTPSQHLPRNAFVSLATLQGLLNLPERANVILVATDQVDKVSTPEAGQALRHALQPTLADYGLRVETVARQPHCVQLSSDRLVLSNAVVEAAERAFARQVLQPIISYLANTLIVGSGTSQRKIPYSTVTGTDSTTELGPLLDDAGQPIRLAADEIALNRWAADELGAKIGDTVTVTFYEPESTHGRLRESAPPPVFKLRAIVELESPGGRSTLAADPQLTPELPGVTDQQSINDWDLPFELVEKIRPQDEEYWDTYRTTPKAFVSLATAERLWASRWGTISLLRFHVDTSPRDSQQRLADGQASEAADAISHRLLNVLKPESLGMTFLPVKEQGLTAAAGTTPFDFLFLAFSFFLMASAVMLIALLFQLGVDQRARELGTLAAVGLGRRRIASLLIREGLIVAVAGAALGCVAGVVYAWIIIAGLRTWWVGALGTPFLDLHVTSRSLALGWLLGTTVAWLTIRWSVRRLVRMPAGRLLAGETVRDRSSAAGGAPRSVVWPIARAVLIVFIAGGLLYSLLGPRARSETVAGMFFGIGVAVLALLVGEVRYRLGGRRTASPHSSGFTLAGLSARNIALNPGRSTLTIGLVAAASFIIVAISSFRLETGEGGTGGFELMATSDDPLHYDLNTTEGRLELGFSDADNAQMERWRVYSLRVADGEDASCLNLYRPSQPRVLGVPESLIVRGGFDWSVAGRQVDTVDDSSSSNPWAELNTVLGTDDSGRAIVPVVLDANTAAYSLHLGGLGTRLTIRDGADQPVTLQVVGLLKNSILQGNLLVSEENFMRLFPETSGYRFFLIEAQANESVQSPRPQRESQRVPGGHRLGENGRPMGAGSIASDRTTPADRNEIARSLESTLADNGVDVVDAREQLAEYLAVQNTYLSTFQSLGALGLLLGTVGLAVVQLRSVLERRGELALMRASGFRNRRLLWMVFAENCLLLFGGLIIGAAAAAVALIPQWLPRNATVPWSALVLLIGTIALVGMAAGWLATRSALRAPIVPALRGD